MTNDYNLLGPTWNASQPITWSFATANFGNSASQFTSYMGATSVFAQQVEAAFARWAQVSGLTFVETPDASAVDIRIGYGAIDGPYNVVASTSYLSSGGVFHPGVTIKFDSGETYTAGSNPQLLNAGGVTFESIALHEIGHSLGLDHYNSAAAIMNASPSGSIIDLTQSDIDGIHALYSHALTASTNSGGQLLSSSTGVDAIYENVLQRHATPDELTAWNATPTPTVASIVGSAEAVQFVDPIVRIYQAAFGRVPDKAGLSFNVNLLHSETIQDVASVFVASSEFTQRYGSNAVSDGLVQALYENVLGREGSSSEVSFWSHGGGSAAQIIAGFAQSSEFQQLSQTAVNNFLTSAAQGQQSYTGSLNSTFDEDHLVVATTGLALTTDHPLA